MKFTTSVNLGNFLKDYSLAESLKMIRECGFDGVDFSLWYFCQGDDAPMYKDNWREFIADVRRMLDENGLCVPQAHAHWRHEGQVQEDFSYALPGEIFERNIEACRMLGCDKLVFHPIQHFFPLKNVAETRKKVIDANAAWFKALMPAAEKYNVQLLVENMFDYMHIQAMDAPAIPMSQGADLMEVIEKVNHPLMRICLDTGHANIAGADVPEMIRLYGDHLRAVHLQDNYGKIYPVYEDIHQFPGTCSLDWEAIFKALKETGCDVSLNMELSAKLAKQPRPIQVHRYVSGRELLTLMAKIYTA